VEGIASVIGSGHIHKKVHLDRLESPRYAQAASDLRGKGVAHRIGGIVMSRLLLGVAAVVAGLSGCASPARYIERGADSGVVAIPANTDEWPSYHRREALTLIQKHLGSNYEIIEEREVATGQRTVNNQHVKSEQVMNRSNPFLPAEKQTVDNTTTTHDITEWRIAYRKVNTPATDTGGIQQTQYIPGTAPPGVYPAGGIGGIVPSCAPGAGVVSAGGMPAAGCADGKCKLR